MDLINYFPELLQVRGKFKIPDGLPPQLNAILMQAMKLPSIRATELIQLREAYEASNQCLSERYFPKPSALEEAEWQVMRQLLLFINTTKVVARTLTSAVYGGSIMRKVEGGTFADEISSFVNDFEYAKSMKAHFINAILYGTSCACPILTEDEELDIYLYDPVGTHLIADPLNVKKIVGIIEFDANNSFLRFQSLWGSGYITKGKYPDNIVIYDKPLPYMHASIARGEDATAHGEVYGISVLKPTLGYNRILTQAFFNTNMLIRWASKSLLILSTDQPDGIRERMESVAGNMAFVLDGTGKGEFIKPEADLDGTIKFIQENLSFLAVLSGLPRTAFQPVDNQSAESARIEGSPLLSQVKQFAGEFSQYEIDFIYRILAFKHYNAGEFKTLKDLKELYQVQVRIKPYFETDNLNTMIDALLKMDNAKYRTPQDIIKELNPDYTDKQIDDLIKERNAELKVNAAPSPPSPEPVAASNDVQAQPEDPLNQAA